MTPVLVVLLLLGAHEVAADSFADIINRPILAPVRSGLAQAIGRALPVTAESPGVSYVFDPATDTFRREGGLLGQLFVESPDTVGRGRWNVGVNYQRVEIDSFDGADLGSLHDTRFPILGPAGTLPFRIPHFGIDLVADQYTASATFGVTDDLDANVTLPVVASDFGLRFTISDQSGSTSRSPEASAAGVGDLFVRGKYRFLRSQPIHLAGALVLRVPTGNEDNFQGTGTVELAPLLVASTPAYRAIRWLELQAYANGGVNLNTENVDDSESRYGIGLDLRVADRVTAAVAFLGRNRFQRIGQPGAFDVPRMDPRTGRRFVAPLFGIEGKRPSFYDLSVGGRVNVWREIVLLYANALLPINNDGFRADVIPLIGVEAVF